MRARSMKWNELVRNFTHPSTVLLDGASQPLCQHRPEQLNRRKTEGFQCFEFSHAPASLRPRLKKPYPIVSLTGLQIPLLRKNLRKIVPQVQEHVHPRGFCSWKACESRRRTLWLTARGLLTDGCVQAQAGAHALLPGALFFVTLFNLGDRGAQGFAAELAHFQI